jgi:hypothetical protein
MSVRDAKRQLLEDTILHSIDFFNVFLSLL